MAQITYLAVLHPKAGGGYGVTFPDLPGCVSDADDLQSAQAAAAEALALHLDGMAEDGESPPRPRDVQELIGELDFTAETGLPAIAAVTVARPDVGERVNVYLPKSLLERVDGFARELGVNRSSVFAMAARRYLVEERRKP